jgi:hypothetical protein
MYTCKKCKVEKPLSEYYKTTDRKARHKTICKECIRSEPKTEAKKEYMREYSKKYFLKARYNLTQEDYTTLLVRQNHKCAICGTDQEELPNKKLYVDHDHETGKVRELLCHNCNVSLGLLKESIQTLTQAIAYLDKHKRI